MAYHDNRVAKVMVLYDKKEYLKILKINFLLSFFSLTFTLYQTKNQSYD
jgi:hypothetical protein